MTRSTRATAWIKTVETQIAPAWKAGMPWNSIISGAAICDECKHRTVFDPNGAAVLFHDAGCSQHKPCRHDGACRNKDHHPPSARPSCQHCRQIMLDKCKPPAAPPSDLALESLAVQDVVGNCGTAILQIGDRVLHHYGAGQTWGYIGCIRWNDYTKEVWIHTAEHPNLVLKEDDIIEVDLHMRDARSAQWK